MAKTFYTEYEIEDLFKRGVMSLEINDNIVLTDLAYEKARRLGMNLVREKGDSPPAAPVRPYIVNSQLVPTAPAAPQASAAAFTPAYPTPGRLSNVDGTDLRQRIKDAVAARMGSQVDAKLLDVIITRVLNSSGVK